MPPALLAALLATIPCAQALASDPEVPPSWSPCAGGASAENSRDTYVALSGGNGTASFEEPINWTFEARFGQRIACDSARRDTLRVDFVYLNEGHAKEFGHRDGFGAQAVLQLPLTARLKAELAAGPLATFNSQNVRGVKQDQKRLGILFTAAIAFDLNGKGLSLRAAFNHSQIFGDHSTDAILIGLGQEFEPVPGGALAGSASGEAMRAHWVAVMGGNSITNNGNAKSAVNWGVEIGARFHDRWAISATFIDQGDDTTRSDRKALGGQLWHVIPITEDWTFTAGAGPMWGRNSRGKQGSELDGLITFRVARSISQNRATKVFVDFSRIFNSSDHGPDADLLRLGLSRAF